MALIGCCGFPLPDPESARVCSAVPRPYLWTEARRDGGRCAFGVMPDGALMPGGATGTPAVPGGKAVDAAGRGLVLTGTLFDEADFARRHHLPPHLSGAALAAAWLERHSADTMAAALDALDGDYTPG